MKEDWRLNLHDQWWQRDRENIESQKIKILEMYDWDQWSTLLEPILELLLKNIEIKINEPFKKKMPEVIEKPIREAIHNIKEKITSGTALQHIKDPHEAALCEVLGRLIAEKTEGDFGVWLMVRKVLLHHSKIYLSWINNISKDSVLQNADRIIKVTAETDINDLAQSYEARENEDYFDNIRQWQSDLQDSNMDAWEFIDFHIGRFDSIRLRGKFSFWGSLLHRSDLKKWIEWVMGLPLIVLKESQLRQIRSLEQGMKIFDEIEEMEYLTAEQQHEFSILILLRNIELWETIDGNLRYFSDKSSFVSDNQDELRSKYSGLFDKWRSNELPEVIEFITDAIANPNKIIAWTTGIQLLRNVYFNPPLQYHPQDKEHNYIRQYLRNMVLKKMTQNSKSIFDLIESITSFKITKTSLLSTNKILLNAITLNRIEDKFEKLANLSLLNFKKILQTDRFYWSQSLNFNFDDSQLAWTFAQIISKMKNSPEIIKTLYNEAYVSSEGWKFNSDQYFNSQPKTSYILIVSSMTSDFLNSVDCFEKAKEIFDWTWDNVHDWTRQIEMNTHIYEINEVLMQLYARLPIIYPKSYDTMALDGFKLLDKLTYVLTAANILYEQIILTDADATFPIQLKKYIKERYETEYRLIKNAYPSYEDQLQWYQSVYDKISKTKK